MDFTCILMHFVNDNFKSTFENNISYNAQCYKQRIHFTFDFSIFVSHKLKTRKSWLQQLFAALTMYEFLREMKFL